MQTLFEREIRSQAELLAARSEEGRAAAVRAADLIDESVTHFVVAARGSSDNAAAYFQYLVGLELGYVAALATPSLYSEPSRMNLYGAAAVAISQSGQSPDVVAVLSAARAQNRPTIAITNDSQSPLARAADVVVPLLVGKEGSLAATKTFLASLQAAADLVQALAKPSRILNDDVSLSSLVQTTTEWALDHLTDIPASLAWNGLTVVGRGLGLCAANECALKIREVAGVRAESYATPDLLHGPIGADGTGSSLWLVVSDEISDDEARDLIGRAADSGLTTLATRPPDRAPSGADVEIVLPVQAPNWVIPFLTVIVGQVMALRLGQVRGRPIDQPPGLKKITLTY